MNKIIAIIAVIVIVAGGIFLFTRSSSAPSSVTSAPSETINPGGVEQASSTSTNPTSTTYTLADIAQHHDQSSCWSAINGGVYDLTNWIAEHPGGPERILSICGIDGSSAFNGQHMNDPRPHQILATMQIGVLAQ